MSCHLKENLLPAEILQFQMKQLSLGFREAGFTRKVAGHKLNPVAFVLKLCSKSE